MPKAKVPVARAPRGVSTDDRISIALMPDELVRLRQKANQQSRSVSSLARLYIVAGMDDEDSRSSRAP